MARDVAEALGSALRATDREWRPIPFLPLTIGVNRYKGKKTPWRAWDIRFTWMREDTSNVQTPVIPPPSAPLHADDEQIEKLASDFASALGEAKWATRNDRQIIPFLPLLIGTRTYRGHVNKKRWWAWQVSFTWIRER